MTLEAIFGPGPRLQRILDFEAALARALARAGVVPTSIAEAIAVDCDASRFDLAEIAREAAVAGNDAIPAVERLRSLVAEHDADAATYVHWGATSQDAMDTTLVLQLREAFVAFDGELAALAAALATLARTHAATPMVGRTLMQHASPTTFGLKAAGWLDALRRHRARLHGARQRMCVVQFGGAVGTLAALGDDGLPVAAALAAELGLQLPIVSWHSNRDRVAEVATTLALLVGTLGKIARDVSLMAQSEIGEVRESLPSGGGRSSTMPHKRNLVGCAKVLSASIRAPGLAATILTAIVQEHERGLGGWQAEWDALPDLCILSHDALAQTTAIVTGLEVDTDRMAKNIEATKGLVFSEAVSFALMPCMGRAPAMDALTRAMRRTTEEGVHLRDALLADAAVRAHLAPEQIEALFDPVAQLGTAATMARAVADERE